jgi:peptidoglycan/xylan/chitin deacetylase (PgdA/CDA1 family)
MSLFQKLRQRSRWALLQGLFVLGGGGRWLRNRPGLRILIYHGVVPAPVRRINARFISTDQLEDQLVYMRKHFQVISLDQAFEGNYDKGRLAVAVTFDDGYRNNLLYALPILQRIKVPATFFVTAPRAAGQDILWTDLLDVGSAVMQPLGVDLKARCKATPQNIPDLLAAFEPARFRSNPRWNPYWEMMDEAELKELSQADGVTIGGHGTLHHNLDRLPFHLALKDVRMGLDWIEKVIGKPVKTFAFPDGAYTPELVNALFEMGLKQLLLTEFRFQDQTDPRLRERLTIHPYLPTKVLMAEILKGHYF